MKAFIILYSLLFYLSTTHAQKPDYTPYEYMYKKQPSNDSFNVNKKQNKQPNIAIDSVDTAKVIGFAVAPLYKKQPESPLGNLMADCMKLYAEKIYNKSIDGAFVNFSGMRSYIPKGEITVGTVLKVMPYDNTIVLITVPGTIFRQFLKYQVSLNGWPCSGISMVIKGKELIDIQINNQPFEETKTYTIAVADYIAKGGNGCTMLKGLPQQDKRYFFRTALIDYIESFTKLGKPVTAAIENRIVYINE